MNKAKVKKQQSGEAHQGRTAGRTSPHLRTTGAAHERRIHQKGKKTAPDNTPKETRRKFKLEEDEEECKTKDQPVVSALTIPARRARKSRNTSSGERAWWFKAAAATPPPASSIAGERLVRLGFGWGETSVDGAGPGSGERIEKWERRLQNLGRNWIFVDGFCNYRKSLGGPLKISLFVSLYYK